MKEFYYNNDKHELFPFPLGGTGTGVIGFSYNGALCSFDLCPSYKTDNAFCNFTAEVYRKNELLSKKLLQSSADSENTEEKFVDNGIYVKFPFVKKIYEKSGFMGRITQTAFTPFIPHNETDSAIPCAYFNFEVENTSDEVLKYTLKGSLGGFFKTYENTVGCTESGGLYINCRDTDTHGGLEGSICLSTNAKSFSYNLCEDNSSFSVSASLNLGPHEKKIVSFVLTWYFPMRENKICPKERFSFETDQEYLERNLVRNYYAQYFESSIECANYCFEHYEHLFSDTKRFSDTLCGSTLPDSFLQAVTASLCAFRSNNVLRLCDGDLYILDNTDTTKKFDTLENAFALQFLYPLIDKRNAENVIKNPLVYSSDNTVVPILRALSSFLITGDFEWLVENWIALTSSIDNLLCKKYENTPLLYAYALKAAEYLSSTVKDKDREIKCRERLSLIPSIFGPGDFIPALVHSDITGISGNFEISSTVLFECEKYYPSLTAAAYTRRNLHKQAELILQNSQSKIYTQNVFSAYSLLCASSGLSYNAYEKYIRLDPQMDFSGDDGVFKCFFSLGTCYGYIERGIDYVEINLLYGKLTIRNFGVPTRPLMVLYGGRKWKYTDEGFCARLDSDLVLTPEKKLTVIIDVKQRDAQTNT